MRKDGRFFLLFPLTGRYKNACVVIFRELLTQEMNDIDNICR